MRNFNISIFVNSEHIKKLLRKKQVSKSNIIRKNGESELFYINENNWIYS